MRRARRWKEGGSPIPCASILLIGALLALAIGCSGRQPPEDSEKADKQRDREVILVSEANDEAVGARAAQDVSRDLGILENPVLSQYVNAIGQRLARHAPHGKFSYTFQIVDQDAPNAFALPGGYVFVSRGLLALSNSEDELANVIGHEIVHVAARHAAARQSVVLGLPGPFRYFALRYIGQFSRDQERAADRLGQNMSAEAGFDPNGLATFLKDLEYTERLRLGASRLPSFLDTHPTTSERAADAAGRARNMIWKRPETGARDRASYLQELEGLVVGPSGAEGVFEKNRFLHADLDLSFRLPDGWNTENTRQAVGATSAKRDAQVYLEFQGPGSDLEAAADAYLKELERNAEKIRVARTRDLKIGDLPAYRMEGQRSSPVGWLYTVITWIVHNETIYRLTGIALPAGAETAHISFLSVARSFRSLTDAERDQIFENHLGIATGREGESLKELSERTGNQWNLQRTAVMNDLFTNQPLRQGQLVKIAVPRPYPPR